MAESFGISQITDYLTRMDLKLAHIDFAKELVEMVFHGQTSQWRMIIGIQQSGNVKKLMFVVPHIARIGEKRRMECLEALLAVNYRIALGKFGLDLEDGEVRLEETVPLANGAITFEQFRLAFGAIMQTVSLYQGLLPRIIQSDISVKEALLACEREYFREKDETTTANVEHPVSEKQGSEEPPELNVEDVLAEVARIFEKSQE